MRILIVTRNLPPLVGGMERLNWHMAEELAKVAEVRVVGPRGSAALAPSGVPVREAPLKPLWNFLWRARALARREARAWKPDIVLAGSGLTAPIARAAARACGARYAAYVHGLDVAVRSAVYRALWLPAIRGADRVIANSRATAALCRGIGVDPARLGIVHPGVDLPHDEPHSLRENGRGEGSSSKPRSPRERGSAEGTNSRNPTKPVSPSASSFLTPRSYDPESSTKSTEDPHISRRVIPGQPRGLNPETISSVKSAPLADAFRQCHHLGDGALLLSVGRLSARKGLIQFVTQALPRIAAAVPDVMLLVVGDAPNQALHAEAQTPDAIRAAAEAVGASSHLRFLGVITDYVELGAVYRSADVHVFPVREIPGDPEGFGMVAVEAAAHGLPTVAFATGGVVDAVSEARSGRLVAPGDYDAFADAIIETLDKRATLQDSCVEFAHQFAWPVFGMQVAQQLGLA